MNGNYGEGDTISLVLDYHPAEMLNLYYKNQNCSKFILSELSLCPELIVDHKKADIITKELYLGEDGFRDTYVNKTHAGEKLKKVVLSYLPLLKKFNVEEAQ